MRLLLQIDQPGRFPLYVKHAHRKGVISVTFDKSKARRFARQDAEMLRQAGQIAASWPEPGTAAFVAEGP
jgi:hypothetical protein